MKPLTRREQAGVAVANAMANAKILIDYADIEALKRQTEAAMNEKLGPLTGPTRAQRRRLKQIENGRLRVTGA